LNDIDPQSENPETRPAGGSEEAAGSETPAESAKAPDPAGGPVTAVQNPPEPPDLSALSIGPESPGEEEQQDPALLYPVVAFGASAGGLDAVREVLANLDPGTGMAFVLVTHLAPNQRSYLSEILERYTRMPVIPLTDGQRPLPNHLHVVQPNQRVTLRRGIFRVEASSGAERVPDRVIDTFFRSLAADQKNHAVGVILSGADSDGAQGLKVIKSEGGIAIVQTPESAGYSGMPRSSIAADHVDMVLPPAEIALELGRLAQQFTRPDVRTLEDGRAAADNEQVLGKILKLLRVQSGLDLRQYKPETIRRRVGRRMLLLRIDRLPDYHRYLEIHADELRQLQEDVLINVTHFFRDAGVWELLQRHVLPALVQDRPAEKPIRIWCAGCSTGEEAYSLAILVLEYLSENGLDIPLQVFGTDATERSIETARLACYSEAIASEITPERLQHYFVKMDRGYQVSKRVRDLCIFARQNLCADPPFSHIDILSCRNVMIYFNQALQRQAMLTFHYALEPGGYLLLGMSEGLREYSEAFTAVDRKHKVYTKIAGSAPNGELPRTYFMSRSPSASRAPLAAVESNIWPERELQRVADRVVLARFGPPGLIIDDHLNVLQSRGMTAQFLEITQGAVSWNLLRVIKDGLVSATRTAVQIAIRDNLPASAEADFVDEQGGKQQIQIDVLPIPGVTSRLRCFLVLFHAIPKGAEGQAAELPSELQLTPDEKDLVIAQLRQDLNATRYHLHSLVEERDSRNQELVSANEEIQSANEELQSTNEELETTKEELQSANEELQTVNDELQQRNNILTQTGNDLTNLLNSVNVPLLMLNSELQIRQFTPPMQRLLSVRPSDIGRSINEIRVQLNIEDLQPILTDVMESLGTREMEVQDKEGRWHLLRVRPYRTADNKIEGLVILLLEIDQLRRSQQLLVDARDFAKSIVESVPVPIVVLNRDGTIRTENTAFRELVQVPAPGLAGHSLSDLAQQFSGLGDIRDKLEQLLGGEPGDRLQFEHESNSGRRKTLLITALSLSADGDRVLLLMIEDISLRREAERLVTREKRQLEGEIAFAAGKLDRTQEELRGLTAHLITMQEEERQRVARELHDDIGQRLSLLEIALQELDAGRREPARERLQSVRDQVHSLNFDVRLLSHRLHPAILKDLGLPAALKALVAEFGEREGMPATFSTQDLPESLPEQPSMELYRIAQEALRNIAKHAGKTHAKVTLSGTGNRLQLKVMDFGIGFDGDAEPPSTGLGMISMKERARLAGGAFHVQSSLGDGTVITVEVPLEANE
jgi:two-component system, chemotaxis family, CheB/CheR fusion protein